MEYLDEENLINNIYEYITKKPQYAILINGEWGSGKTYFLDHALADFFKEKDLPFCKISLYGITSKREIDNIIVQNRISNLPNVGKIFGLGYKYSSILGEIATNTLIKSEEIKNQINSKKLIDSLVDKLTIVDEDIIIFDDLERCNLSINEIFGYIDDYVESKHCSCIIVANEKEIAKTSFNNNIELKYLVAKLTNDENITEEVIDSQGGYGVYNNTSNQKKYTKYRINKEKLQDRINDLFSEDLEYKNIKEKLIGKTFYYKPNIEIVLDNLIEHSSMTDANKIFMKKNRNQFLEIIEDEKCNNIRTLKFAIEVCEKILEELAKINKNRNIDGIFDILKIYIIKYIFYASIKEKNGELNNSWIGETEYYQKSINNSLINILWCFKFIDDFIKEGFFNSERINTVVQSFIKEFSQNARDENNPLNILKYFWENDDDIIIEKMNELRDGIENYDINTYPKIIAILVKLKKADFDEKVINEIIGAMKFVANKSTRKRNMDLNALDVHFDNKQDYEEYKSIINEFKDILKIRYEKSREEIINNILDEEEWGEKVRELYYSHKNDNYFYDGFLKLFDIEKLSEKLFSSNTRNISDFRRTTASVYEYYGKELYMKDIENILKLNEKIEKELIKGVNEKSKKYNFNLFNNLLKNIIEENKSSK